MAFDQYLTTTIAKDKSFLEVQEHEDIINQREVFKNMREMLKNGLGEIEKVNRYIVQHKSISTLQKHNTRGADV